MVCMSVLVDKDSVNEIAQFTGFYKPARVESNFCPEVLDITPSWKEIKHNPKGINLATTACRIEQVPVYLRLPRPDSENLKPYITWDKDPWRAAKQAVYNLSLKKQRNFKSRKKISGSWPESQSSSRLADEQ